MTVQPLPDLSSEYRVLPAHSAAYREQGHVLLRRVCSPEEIESYRAVLNDTVKRLNTEARALEERDTYGKAFLQTMNLWVHDDGAKQFVFARRFARIASELMGVPAARLYHDQALYKEPGGGRTPWHQDQHYWPLDTNNTITMWMPLVDLSPEMGIMNFASSSHTEGYLGDIPISDESESFFENFVKEKGFRLTEPEPMRAGDATFHSGWTLHSAPGNHTDRMREVMTIIYFPNGVMVKTPDNKNRQNDLDAWLPGCRGGEPAASKLNPVLYP